MIVAALADGASTILNPLFSEDSYWLMDALTRLGFSVHADRERAEVTILGQAGKVPNLESKVEVYVGNAGTRSPLPSATTLTWRRRIQDRRHAKDAGASCR